MSDIYLGNCLEIRSVIPDNSVDTVITDPPYLLDFMGKSWDASKGDIPNADLSFRSWFAGLVAGEGYFRIHREKDGAYYACHFGIHMRADEGPLLRGLANKLGFGSIKDDPAVENRQGIHSAPSIRWEVVSKEDCWKLAALLDGVPLLGKKQREFDLWFQALNTWSNTKRGNRWHGPRDNQPMEKLWQQMKELRPFDEDLAASTFDPFSQPDYLFHYRWAREMLHVTKPGGMLLAFGGTRTFHRMTVAIEDAGWQIRDCIMWLYGSGFPKSLDISKAIDKAKGAEREVVGKSDRHGGGMNQVYGEGMGDGKVPNLTAPSTDLAREWSGWGTALKPAWEPIIVAMKPLDGTFAENAEKWGVAGINVEGGRVGTSKRHPGNYTSNEFGGRTTGAFRESDRSTFDDAKGRWPANLILDEDAAAMLDGQSGERKTGSIKPYKSESNGYEGGWGLERTSSHTGDSGGASRFFYCAKASKSERNRGCEGLLALPAGGLAGRNDGSLGKQTISHNTHPTVKPLSLMEYLCTLTKTPSGGIVLDPFAGSGSTLLAAKNTGREYIGIEQNPEYFEIIKARLGLL